MSSYKDYDESLLWNIKNRELLLHTAVFDLYKQKEKANVGIEGDYVAMDAPPWIVTIPVYNDCFIMVRQFRHALEKITMEFPGGIGSYSEDPAVSAGRELMEETGFVPGKLTLLGRVSPNPALFKNTVYFYLAEDLIKSGDQHLDEDEVLKYMPVPINEVINQFGDEENTHAFMGTALFLYLRHIGKITIS